MCMCMFTVYVYVQCVCARVCFWQSAFGVNCRCKFKLAVCKAVDVSMRCQLTRFSFSICVCTFQDFGGRALPPCVWPEHAPKFSSLPSFAWGGASTQSEGDACAFNSEQSKSRRVAPLRSLKQFLCAAVAVSGLCLCQVFCLPLVATPVQGAHAHACSGNLCAKRIEVRACVFT